MKYYRLVFRLIYSLILNMILVFVLCITMPDQTSTFLRLLHGSVCLSALIISRVCSSVWFSDIANASLKYTGVQTPSLSLRYAWLYAFVLRTVHTHNTFHVREITKP